MNFIANNSINLLLELFGAFLGFLSAMGVYGFSQRREHKKKYEQVVKSLQGELQDLLPALEKCEENNIVLRSRIGTPTWDALQYSGLTLELIDEPYFDVLIYTYSLIKAHNEERINEKDTMILDRIAEMTKSIRETLDIMNKGEK